MPLPCGACMSTLCVPAAPRGQEKGGNLLALGTQSGGTPTRGAPLGLLCGNEGTKKGQGGRRLRLNRPIPTAARAPPPPLSPTSRRSMIAHQRATRHRHTSSRRFFPERGFVFPSPRGPFSRSSSNHCPWAQMGQCGGSSSPRLLVSSYLNHALVTSTLPPYLSPLLSHPSSHHHPQGHTTMVRPAILLLGCLVLGLLVRTRLKGVLGGEWDGWARLGAPTDYTTTHALCPCPPTSCVEPPCQRGSPS